MTWTKLGDEYLEDCFRLSTDAFRLHTEGLVYSTGKNLDGRLEKARMLRWAYNTDAVTELVDTGFWTDEGDHYQIRAHMGWQLTAEQVLERSMRNKINRAKGKARPVKNPQVADDSSDDPSDRLSDQRDGTGRDGTGQEKTLLREVIQNTQNSHNGNGSGHILCRYCDNELPAHMRSQQSRGFCSRPVCMAEAKAELS
jgi:hypothetical protein